MVKLIKATAGLLFLAAITQSSPSFADEPPTPQSQKVEQLEEIQPTNTFDWSGEQNNNVGNKPNYQIINDRNNSVDSVETEPLEWQRENVGDAPKEGGSIPVIGF